MDIGMDTMVDSDSLRDQRVENLALQAVTKGQAKAGVVLEMAQARTHRSSHTAKVARCESRRKVFMAKEQWQERRQRP